MDRLPCPARRNLLRQRTPRRGRVRGDAALPDLARGLSRLCGVVIPQDHRLGLQEPDPIEIGKPPSRAVWPAEAGAAMARSSGAAAAHQARDRWSFEGLEPPRRGALISLNLIPRSRLLRSRRRSGSRAALQTATGPGGFAPRSGHGGRHTSRLGRARTRQQERKLIAATTGVDHGTY